MCKKYHSVKIDEDTYSRLQSLKSKTRLPITAIICRAIDGFDITVQGTKL